jgi:hypothetical protein
MGRPKGSKNKKPASPVTGYGAAIVPRDPEPQIEIHDEEEMAALPAEQQIPLVNKPVTFFSRFREDELLMTTASRIQVDQNRWITQPASTVKFRDRAFVTNDKVKIEFLRNHPRYGRQIFEFGVPTHDKAIAQIDDAGRIIELEKLHRLGRVMMSRERVR